MQENNSNSESTSADTSNDIFTDALQESGGQFVDESTTSEAEKSAEQTPEQTTESKTETGSEEQTQSETQSAEETTTEEAAATEAETNHNKTGIIDLNSEEASTEETSTENQTTTSETNQISVNEMFGEGYESVDEVKEQLELVPLLEERLEELEGATPEYANDFVKKMDEFARNGGDPVKFATFNGLDVDNLSAADAIKKNLEWEHNMTPGEAQTYMDSKYKTEDFDDEDGTKTDPKSVYMKVEATSAKDNLRKMQADNTLVEQAAAVEGLSEEQWLEKQQEAQVEMGKQDEVRMEDEKTGWFSEVSKVVSDIQEKGVTINLGNGKGFNFAYDKEADYTDNFIKEIDQALYDSGESRQSNPALAKDIAELVFLRDNKDAMFKSYGDEIRSMKDDEYHTLMHNPSAIPKGTPPTTQNNKVPSTEEQMEGIWS